MTYKEKPLKSREENEVTKEKGTGKRRDIKFISILF
jgi:hypothetical protein